MEAGDHILQEKSRYVIGAFLAAQPEPDPALKVVKALYITQE